MKSISLLIILLFSKISVADSLHLPKKEVIVVQLKENDKSKIENIISEAKDWIGIGLAIFGLIAGYRLLRKKLLENHISKALTDIQETNKKTLLETEKLIDELTPKTFQSSLIQTQDLEDIYNRVQELYFFSQGGSSECQTILNYLKSTLQYTTKEYDLNTIGTESIESNDLYCFVINTLYIVVYYSTQAVPVPKSGKTDTIRIFKKEVGKYLSHSKITKYRHFKQGYINDPNSALYMSFISEVNECHSSLLKRSAFKIHLSNRSLSILSVQHKFYAPLRLKLTNSNKEYILELIGFRHYVTTFGNEKEYWIQLNYTNPIDNERFVKKMLKDDAIFKFKDDTIPDSGFEISSQRRKPSYKYLETIVCEFDQEYLERLFKHNRWKLKRTLRPNWVTRFVKYLRRR